MRNKVWMTVVWAVMVALSPATAQEQPSVERLVEQLGAASSKQRDDATLRLAQRGPSARPALERAASSFDVEVALRARQLLDFLKVEQLWLPTVCGPFEMPAATSDEASAPLASKLFTQIARQTGNRLLLGDSFGSFHDMRVAFSDIPDRSPPGSTPFWIAVDALCRQSGNHVRPSYHKNQSGLVVVTGDEGDCPVAYAGPMRGTITSVRRAYVEESEFQAGHVRVTHSFQLSVQLIWEDRLHLVAYQNRPELIDARSDTGDALTMNQPGRSGWSVVTPSRRQLAFQLRLDPPSWKARSLESLRVQFGLVAVGDPRTVVLQNLEDTALRQFEGVAAVIEKLKRKDAGWEVTVHMMPESAVPSPPEALFHENQFEAFDSQGSTMTLRDTSHWPSDDGVRFSLLFAAAKDEAPPERLQITYPMIRSHRHVELAWHDIPLPASREP